MLSIHHLKKRINKERDELHHLMEYEELSSFDVQKQSQELDCLILCYYRQNKDDQHLNEP